MLPTQSFVGARDRLGTRLRVWDGALNILCVNRSDHLFVNLVVVGVTRLWDEERAKESPLQRGK